MRKYKEKKLIVSLLRKDNELNGSYKFNFCSGKWHKVHKVLKLLVIKCLYKGEIKYCGASYQLGLT